MKSKMAFKLGLASILGALVLCTGCAGSAPPGATAADAARAHTSVAALEQGRSLYMAHCGACHVPPAPTSQPVSAWPGHVDEMQTRAHLTPQEASLVKQYLVAVASR
jgi:mono/diheme cytochrome c family protein